MFLALGLHAIEPKVNQFVDEGLVSSAGDLEMAIDAKSAENFESEFNEALDEGCVSSAGDLPAPTQAKLGKRLKYR